jgi:hypothetical protein
MFEKSAETRRQPPKFFKKYGEEIVQTTNSDGDENHSGTLMCRLQVRFLSGTP